MSTTETTTTSSHNRTDIGRQQRRGRIRLAAAVTAAVVGITACGTDSGSQAGSSTSEADHTASSAPSASTASAARPTEPVDRLVGLDGARVHVRCVGQGATTVVLISGFGGDTSAWTEVEPAVSDNARLCSYDRPGTGSSDAPASTATFATQAADLRQLLVQVGEPGPFVVVGHSFGGGAAVAFASQFADDVSGLVLVDASPTTWPSALCAVPDDGSQGAATLRGLCSSSFPPTGNPERLDVRAAFAEVADIASLGSLPMAVITATERELPTDLDPAERTRLTEQWNRGQQEWAALSNASHVVTVDHTGHDIQLDQPQVVIDQITRLLP